MEIQGALLLWNILLKSAVYKATHWRIYLPCRAIPASCIPPSSRLQPRSKSLTTSRISVEARRPLTETSLRCAPPGSSRVEQLKMWPPEKSQNPWVFSASMVHFNGVKQGNLPGFCIISQRECVSLAEYYKQWINHVYVVRKGPRVFPLCRKFAPWFGMFGAFDVTLKFGESNEIPVAKPILITPQTPNLNPTWMFLGTQ